MTESRVESRESRDRAPSLSFGSGTPPLTPHPSPLISLLFAGGGSGGHLFPGIAVAEELARRDPRTRIVFVGSERGIERTVLGSTGWRHAALPVLPPAAARRHPFRFATGFARSVSGALRLIDQYRPQAVIGLGGFASVPVAIAARRRRIPLLLLEQNVVPGRATSLLSRWAETVCVSFPETIPLLPRGSRAVPTGNPVRGEVRSLARRSPDLSDARTLLVLGGSQGATGLNSMAVGAASMLRVPLTGWSVVHQTGERDAAAVRTAYAELGIAAEVAPFFSDLPRRCAGAALALSRAGATSLAELACFGLPAILVPYPGSVRDHQQRNAELFEAAGAAIVFPEARRSSERLAATMESLLGGTERLAGMSAAMRRLARPAAAEAVADLFLPQVRAAAA